MPGAIAPASFSTIAPARSSRNQEFNRSAEALRNLVLKSGFFNRARIIKVDQNTGTAFDAIPVDVAFGSVGAEYDPRDETILASTGSAFYRIDIYTGVGTRVAPLDGEGNWDDLAYLTNALECP